MDSCTSKKFPFQNNNSSHRGTNCRHIISCFQRPNPSGSWQQANETWNHRCSWLGGQGGFGGLNKAGAFVPYLHTGKFTRKGFGRCCLSCLLYYISIHLSPSAHKQLRRHLHRGAIPEAPCTIKSVKSLIYSYCVSNCFITYTVNHRIIWCDHVKSTWKYRSHSPYKSFRWHLGAAPQWTSPEPFLWIPLYKLRDQLNQ